VPALRLHLRGDDVQAQELAVRRAEQALAQAVLRLITGVDEADELVDQLVLTTELFFDPCERAGLGMVRVSPEKGAYLPQKRPEGKRLSALPFPEVRQVELDLLEWLGTKVRPRRFDGVAQGPPPSAVQAVDLEALASRVEEPKVTHPLACVDGHLARAIDGFGAR